MYRRSKRYGKRKIPFLVDKEDLKITHETHINFTRFPKPHEID